MSMGTGALNVGRGPEHFRPKQGGIHCNPVSGEPPLQAAANLLHQTEPDQWKDTHLTPHTYQEGLKHLKGRSGWGLKLLHVCK